jgi:hypothetical protein
VVEERRLSVRVERTDRRKKVTKRIFSVDTRLDGMSGVGHSQRGRRREWEKEQVMGSLTGERSLQSAEWTGRRGRGRRERRITHPLKGTWGESKNLCGNFSPAATRNISSTRSSPVISSVIGCSTWSLVFISRK